MITLFDVGFYGTSAEDPDNDLRYETVVPINTEGLSEVDFIEDFFKDIAVEYLNSSLLVYEIADYDIDFIAFRSRVDDTYCGLEVQWNNNKDEYEVL
jgi:hypothetical protein